MRAYLSLVLTLLLVGLHAVRPPASRAEDEGEKARSIIEGLAAEPDDGPNDALALGTLVDEGFVEGTIDRTSAIRGRAIGDEDWVSFEVKTPGDLIAMLEMPKGSDFDLALFDGDGRRLATSRAANGRGEVDELESLLHHLPRAGTYALAVLGYGGRPGRWSLAFRLQTSPRLGSDASKVSWTTVGPMREPRAHHAVAALQGGGAWVVGGTLDTRSAKAALATAHRTTERFDPETGEFVEGPDLSFPRFAPTATTLPTGRVIVAGGDILGTADLCDPWLDYKLTGKALKLPQGMRVMHTATLLPDGRVLIAGGSSARVLPEPKERLLATTAIFDPKTRTFAAGPRLSAPRSGHAAALLQDGRVLLIGGRRRADCDIVDLRAIEPKVEAGPKLPQVLDDMTATTLLDGRVLVLGGQVEGGRSVDRALLYTPDGTFVTLPARMARPRSDHQALRLEDGSVLVLGGEADPGDGRKDRLLDVVERFDPATRRFLPWPALPRPMDDHRVVRLLDGRLLVTGGVSKTDVAEAHAFVISSR